MPRSELAIVLLAYVVLISGSLVLSQPAKPQWCQEVGRSVFAGCVQLVVVGLVINYLLRRREYRVRTLVTRPYARLLLDRVNICESGLDELVDDVAKRDIDAILRRRGLAH